MRSKAKAKKRAEEIKKIKAAQEKRMNGDKKGVPVSPGGGRPKQKNKKPTGRKTNKSNDRYRW